VSGLPSGPRTYFLGRQGPVMWVSRSAKSRTKFTFEFEDFSNQEQKKRCTWCGRGVAAAWRALCRSTRRATARRWRACCPSVMGSIGSLRCAIWPAYRAGAALVERTSIPALDLLPMIRDQNLMGPNKGRADVSIRAFAVRRPIFWSGRIGMIRNSPGRCACRIGGLVRLGCVDKPIDARIAN
jgi:hypothetical protein